MGGEGRGAAGSNVDAEWRKLEACQVVRIGDQCVFRQTILLLYREEEEEAVITILIPCNRGRGPNMKDGAAFLDDGSNGKLCVSGIYSASKMKWKLSPKQLGGRIRKY